LTSPVRSLQAFVFSLSPFWDFFLSVAPCPFATIKLEKKDIFKLLGFCRGNFILCFYVKLGKITDLKNES
jgi:hypothetical protein